ncbi:phage virion morphogenesis protein [Ancylobacter sp. G4_0304]|uniref:phage virion morphogenesis protein n=1 Tax=Ancylobacter sp. G4_0304 TaxID=3114289 RepID=UPI0039C74E35
MSGISIVVEIDGVLPVDMLERLAGADTTPLMTDIGAVLESSMRERVEDTKTGPDGTPWAPNRAGTSTLLETGRHLRDSFAFIASQDQVLAGASWEYAHVHQDGAVIKAKDGGRLSFLMGGKRVFAKKVTIPARPFAGISTDDESEIQRVTREWLQSHISGLGEGLQ